MAIYSPPLKPTAMADDIIYIAQLEKKARNRQVWICLALLLLGLFLFLYPLDTPQETAHYFVWGSGLFFIALGLGATGYLYRVGPFYRLSIADLLVQKPMNIVWVYHHIVQTMPFGVEVSQMTTLYVFMDDGNFQTLRVKAAGIDRLLDQLKIRLPHVTFGYSEEKAFLYKTNPRLLITD